MNDIEKHAVLNQIAASSDQSKIKRLKKQQLKTETEEDNSKPYPVLDGLKDAMEFFLEYDKKHKENKVRLTTDFGSIDILLFNTFIEYKFMLFILIILIFINLF